MSRKDFIEKIVRVANQAIPNSEIYLYGSRARGDNNTYSDWDLLILLNTKQPSFEVETKIMDAFYDLELESGQVVSPLIYSKEDWTLYHTEVPLFKSIQTDGLRIK